MSCDQLADSLPGLIDQSVRLDRAGRRHLQTCLRCQADVARYRKIARSLHGMPVDEHTPPIGLLESLLAAIHDADASATRGQMTGRRVAYVGGIAATAAAGAGAALVLVNRGRRVRLALAG